MAACCLSCYMFTLACKASIPTGLFKHYYGTHINFTTNLSATQQHLRCQVINVTIIMSDSAYNCESEDKQNTCKHHARQVRLTCDNQMSGCTDGRSILSSNASEVCGVDSYCGWDSYIQAEIMILTPRLGVCNYFSEYEAEFIFIHRLTMRVHNGVVDVPPCIHSLCFAGEVYNFVDFRNRVGWTFDDN